MLHDAIHKEFMDYALQISEEYKSIIDNKLIDFSKIDKSKILFVKKYMVNKMIRQ